MNWRTNPTCCLLLFVSLALGIRSESSAEETDAVAARAQAYVSVFNERDIDGCLEFWSEDAEYVLADTGTRIQGRESIREALDKLLSTDESFALSVSGQQFRRVAKDVVLEEGTATVVSPSHGLEQAKYLVVHVKRDGKWYRDSVRETTSARPQAAASQLRELEWLLGHWRAEGETGSIELESEWMNGKRFLSRSFKVRGKDGYELDGMQIIGWDPSSAVIRSWSFDSEGGFERAVWNGSGQRWLIKVNAVLPDGSIGSEQRLVTHDGNGQIETKVIEQQVDGQLLPGSAPVTLIRQSND